MLGFVQRPVEAEAAFVHSGVTERTFRRWVVAGRASSPGGSPYGESLALGRVVEGEVVCNSVGVKASLDVKRRSVRGLRDVKSRNGHRLVG